MYTGILALEDGTVLKGVSFGAKATVVGEAVFNTSLTGYQEILSDPSYTAQIIVMTMPQIGNYGVTEQDNEFAAGPKSAALVVRSVSPVASNWRSEMTLQAYLEKYGIPGLSGIDTRFITKKLRVTGAMKCCVSTEGISPEEAVRRAREWCGMEGLDLVTQSTCAKPYTWDVEGKLSHAFEVPGTRLGFVPPGQRKRYRIAAYDFGCKLNILRRLHEFGFEVIVFPAQTPAEKLLEVNPDGIFLSNGPGDPAAVTYAHENVRKLIGKKPIFGICLGHQIISHAIGATTFKLKFGHRGGNQPVKNLENGRVTITSQNHGFSSDPERLKECGAIVTEINLNDGTVEGLRLKDHPVFSVQYHPEAAPGPHDSTYLFDEFHKLIAANEGK